MKEGIKTNKLFKIRIIAMIAITFIFSLGKEVFAAKPANFLEKVVYVEGVKDACQDNNMHIVIGIMGIILIVALYFIKHKILTEGDVVATVEFEPPEGFNPVDIAYYYYGYTTSDSVMALVLHLANEGYIKIEQRENVYSPEYKEVVQKTVEFYKLKDYDGDDKIEKTVMEGLFKKYEHVLMNEEGRITHINDTIMDDKYGIFKWTDKPVDNDMKLKDHVSEYDARRKTINMVKRVQAIINFSGRYDIFDESDERFKITGIIMIGIMLFCFLVQARDISLAYTLSLIIFTIPSSLLTFGLIKKIEKAPNNAEDRINLDGVIFIILCSLAYMAYYMIEMLGTAVIGVHFGLVAVLLAADAILEDNVKKRTPEAQKVYAKICGLRRYFVKVEEEKMAKLIEDDPEYFYKIVPYALALNVSNSWTKWFTGLILPNYNRYSAEHQMVFSEVFRIFKKILAELKPSNLFGPGKTIEEIEAEKNMKKMKEKEAYENQAKNDEQNIDPNKSMQDIMNEEIEKHTADYIDTEIEVNANRERSREIDELNKY